MTTNIDKLIGQNCNGDTNEDAIDSDPHKTTCDHPELRVTGEVFSSKCPFEKDVLGTEPPYYRIRCAQCSDKRGYVGSELLDLYNISEEYREPGVWGPEKKLTIDLK